MKKQLLFASTLMLALSLASCANEDESLNIQENEYTIEAVVGGSHSRTLLQADSKGVVWSEGDQIFLFGGKSYGDFTLSNGSGNKVGTFKGTVRGSLDELETALYPKPIEEDGSYYYDFSANREYTRNSNSPMIGDFSDGNITFQNLVPIVRIVLSELSENNDNTLSIEMSDSISGKGIVGRGKVDVENKTITFEPAEGTLKITIPAGQTSAVVDIPVPAGDYNRINFTLNDTIVLVDVTNETISLNNNDGIVFTNVAEKYNEETKKTTYTIYTAEELFWLAQQVNTGNTFEGDTIILANDIDLENIPWTPIGSTESIALRSNKWPNNYWFRGVFDGNGKTIKNINAKSNYCTGLFGAVYGDNGKAVIKNLKIENVTISGHHWAAALLAYGYGVAIENCEVVGATISCTGTDEGGVDREGDNNWGGDKAGALLGQMYFGNGTVSNCKASNCTVSAGRDAGQLIGAADVSYVDNTNQVDNISVTWNETDDGSNIANELIGRKK